MVLDGKVCAKNLREAIASQIDKFKFGIANFVVPHLYIIDVGDDPASKIYVRNKVKALSECNMQCTVVSLGNDSTKEEVLDVIDRLNLDPSATAVMLQLPLPKQLQPSEREILNSIAPEKDVECLGATAYGNFFFNSQNEEISTIVGPCTPVGIMLLLKHYDISIGGKNVLIINRSNIVGRPLAHLLTNANATVTLAHSKTDDIPSLCREADIIITATGRPNSITPELINENKTILIDVSINRSADGKLCGDASPAATVVCKDYTPVPGGCGPMTVAALCHNLLQSSLKNLKK